MPPLISVYFLERTQIVPQPRAKVFAFFADAANLERMTPPFLGFQILTPQPIVMQAGARIDYRIKLHGLPMTWHTIIEEYAPPDRFVDVQQKGPYSHWHHLHTFRELPDGRTEIGDHVTYELPLGPLGRLAHVLFVKRQLQTIFNHREHVMSELFG